MSRERYIKKLEEQLQSIQISSAAFDAGHEFEAVRLATSMRVLFNRTNRQTPLLDLLKLSNVTMLSSAGADCDWKGFVITQLNLGSSTPVKCLPKLENKFVPMPLHQWWDGQVIYHFENRDYHRRQLVTTAADQDGGAHVDKHLEKFYEDLENGNQGLSINGENLVYPGGAPYNQAIQQPARNTHFVMLRQFAHEVIASASHFDWFSQLVAA